MIHIKTDHDVAMLRCSAGLVGEVLAEMARRIAPGVRTIDLDKMGEEMIRDAGFQPMGLQEEFAAGKKPREITPSLAGYFCEKNE